MEKTQVFYDSWSIQPGDGIIDQMSKGLEAPDYVFFFVSQNSLASGMVKLEWQNALYAASQGTTRIVPVRIDGSEMPAILKQTLFIDMHTVGLDAAIAQIVSVTQGNASYTPQHLGFSNLSYERHQAVDGTVEIVIKASHLMEPNPHFAAVVDNAESELEWEMVPNRPFLGGFNPDVYRAASGETAHALSFQPLGGTLTPEHPIRLRLKPTGTKPINLLDLFHQKSETHWVALPVSAG